MKNVSNMLLKVPLLGNSVRNTPMIVVMNSPRYAGTTYMHSLGYSIAFCPYVDNDDDVLHRLFIMKQWGMASDIWEMNMMMCMTVKSRQMLWRN